MVGEYERRVITLELARAFKIIVIFTVIIIATENILYFDVCFTCKNVQ